MPSREEEIESFLRLINNDPQAIEVVEALGSRRGRRPDIIEMLIQQKITGHNVWKLFYELSNEDIGKMGSLLKEGTARQLLGLN